MSRSQRTAQAHALTLLFYKHLRLSICCYSFPDVIAVSMSGLAPVGLDLDGHDRTMAVEVTVTPYSQRWSLSKDARYPWECTGWASELFANLLSLKWQWQPLPLDSDIKREAQPLTFYLWPIHRCLGKCRQWRWSSLSDSWSLPDHASGLPGTCQGNSGSGDRCSFAPAARLSPVHGSESVARPSSLWVVSLVPVNPLRSQKLVQQGKWRDVKWNDSFNRIEMFRSA